MPRPAWLPLPPQHDNVWVPGNRIGFLLMLPLKWAPKDHPGGEASKVRGRGETQGEVRFFFYSPFYLHPLSDS